VFLMCSLCVPYRTVEKQELLGGFDDTLR